MPECSKEGYHRSATIEIGHLRIETPVSIAGICLFNVSSIALNSVLYLTNNNTKVDFCQVEVKKDKNKPIYEWATINNSAAALNKCPVYITLQYTKA